MKITIKSTDKLTKIDGVPVRVWEGLSEGGSRCQVFVHRVCVHADENALEFDKELQAKLPPDNMIDLRFILP